MFLHFVTLWPWPLTVWPNIKWVYGVLVVNYPCGIKFGDRIVLAVLVLSCGQTRTYTQTRINVIFPRLSSAWVTSITSRHTVVSLCSLFSWSDFLHVEKSLLLSLDNSVKTARDCNMSGEHVYRWILLAIQCQSTHRPSSMSQRACERDLYWRNTNNE